MQFKGLRSYILEDEFKITILNDKINIANYDSMGHFDNNKVIVNYNKAGDIKSLIINGKQLVVSRLKLNEVLIEGVITSLEFR